MNINTAKERLRNPDTVLEAEYRAVYDTIIDVLESLEADDTTNVAMPLLDTLLSLRSATNAIARDLGLLGTIVNIEAERAEEYVLTIEPA